MSRELTLRSLDIPSIHRFGIGFDSMFDELLRVANNQPQTNYPPHNIIKTGEESIWIEIAVAGFLETEISVTVENNVLVVTGEYARNEPANYEYYHRGLSRRDFTLKFKLAEYVEVVNASLTNGILSVYLERKVPEEKLPKKIAINVTK
jgi:molecular chaperone IbpA